MVCRPAHTLYVVLIFLLLAETIPLRAQEEAWKKLDAQAEKLLKEARYAEALEAAKEALKVAENTFGAETLNAAAALNRLGEVCEKQGNYADAETLLQRALSIREKILGSENYDVAASLNMLGELYGTEGKYSEAEEVFQRALSIREKILGPEHLDVAQSQEGLAEVYRVQGKYARAEPLYRHALAVREKALGPEHVDVAESLNDLALLYEAQGKYAEAESLYVRALAIFEGALGPEHPDLAIVLGNLAAVYWEEGKYADAETLDRRALSIREKVLGPDHRDVGIALNILGLLYYDEGKYGEAEPLLERAVAIFQKTFGAEHLFVATAQHNLARVYSGEGKNTEAESLYLRSLATVEKALGPEHPTVAMCLSNLGRLYISQARYTEAEPLLQRAVSIFQKALGPDHPSLATAERNLARVYRAQGKYADAESLYQRALAIFEATLGSDHPYVALSLKDLAELDWVEGKDEEAGQRFDGSLQNLALQFHRYFSYMSEKERLEFLDKVSSVFPLYFSFCFSTHARSPQLAAKMYDVLLWQKGLVASSIASLRSRVAANGDKETFAMFGKLAEDRTRLAALLVSTPRDREGWRTTVEHLKEESNDLERQLALRSDALEETQRLARSGWRDVQKALAEHDAAVEFVRFPFHNGKELTNDVYYVALVVTATTKMAPTLVLLGDAGKLEGSCRHEYRNWVSRSSLSSRSELYQCFWKPLELALGDSKRIYLSPDGILNEISLGIIPTLSGQLLMEKYNLRVVSSTRDLLRQRTTKWTNDAVLVGNPRFDLTEAQQRIAATRIREAEEPETEFEWLGSGLRSRDGQTTHLSALPGAQVELERVRFLLEEHNWRVHTFTRENALVDIVKRVQGPRVLHLATHGFFLSDQEREGPNSFRDLPSGAEDPMLRSGLYFAGADRVLSGTSSAPGLDDGVLTAYEASGLNLQGTELVVLSGCETGLGQVKNGEGVFGLLRGLQEAGAQSVLMSLWSVPDRETQELMTKFYKHWLSGKDKTSALRAAQLELRQIVKTRYGQDRPFYWGGFVLVGN
jgi:tetratricopeptide (TPR) repeat protein